MTVYNVPADMAILNACEEAIWLASYGPTRTVFVWGNKAALEVMQPWLAMQFVALT